MLPPIEQQVTVNCTTCPYTHSALVAIASGRHRADLIKMILENHFRLQAQAPSDSTGRVGAISIHPPAPDTQSPTATFELNIDNDEFGQAFSSFFQ